jgi:hypothetical protein
MSTRPAAENIERQITWFKANSSFRESISVMLSDMMRKVGDQGDDYAELTLIDEPS